MFPSNDESGKPAYSDLFSLKTIRNGTFECRGVPLACPDPRFGVPPIPVSLAREVQPYTSIYGLPLAGWDSTKREILLKGLSSVTWISRVSSPGATPHNSLIYIQSNGIYDVYFQPQGKYLVYTRDAAGKTTVDVPIKRGVAKVEMPIDGHAKITVASGVVTGNELEVAGGR